MTRYGTAHFITRRAALAYYRAQGFRAADIDQKLTDGEIHIGPPTVKPGERLDVDGGRYFIVEG